MVAHYAVVCNVRRCHDQTMVANFGIPQGIGSFVDRDTFSDQNIYRILFQKSKNVTQALEIIKSEFESSPERDLILEFLEDSPRGILKGYATRGNE